MKKRKQYQVYGDLLQKHRPTIRSLVLEILYAKFVEIKRGKVSAYRENAVLPPFQDNKPDMSAKAKFVAVIDSSNTVVEVLKMNEKAADILASNTNTFTVFDPEVQLVKIGTTIKDGEFINENEEN